MDIIILGAGPAGLAAALALSKISTPTSPVRITIFELRPCVQTIGGTVHVTPQSLELLDQLGVYERLKLQGIEVRGIDVIPVKTGAVARVIQKGQPTKEGNTGMRLSRHSIVEIMLKTIEEGHMNNVTIRFGMQVTAIEQTEQKAVLYFENGEKVEGDVLLGCDGLHSATRRLHVDPDRKIIYLERVAMLGFFDTEEPGRSGISLANGEDGVRDTSIFTFAFGSLLLSYYERTRSKIFIGNVIPFAEPSGDLRDGWKVAATQMDSIRDSLDKLTWTTHVTGLKEAVHRTGEWQLWPIYILPSEGVWTRGRALLLGEAAHSMPPQGESIGIALEDSIFLAKLFEQRDSKTVNELFTGYEEARRPSINALYVAAMKYWHSLLSNSS